MLNVLHRAYLIFFSVRSNFISSNEHQKQYFHQVLVFISEIKFDLTLKKSNCLFLLCFYSLPKRLRIRSVISVNYLYITVLCPFNLLIRFKCYNTV